MSDSYDPGEFTVEEVKEYVGEHPEEAGAIRDAEAAGKARVTLLDWLDSELAADAPAEEAQDTSDEYPAGQPPEAPEPLPDGNVTPPDADESVKVASPTQNPPIPAPQGVVKATQYRTP